MEVQDTLDTTPAPDPINWDLAQPAVKGDFQEGFDAIMAQKAEEQGLTTTLGTFEVAPTPEPAKEEEAPKAEPEAAKPGIGPDGFDYSVFAQEIPGSVINSQEDLVTHFKAGVRATQDIEELNRLGNTHPEVVDVIKALQSGQSFGDAVSQYTPTETPDKHEDPEGWANHQIAQARAQDAQAARDRDTKATQSRMDRGRREADTAWQAFKTQSGMSDHEANAYLRTYNSMFGGDPTTGAFRQDAFEIVHRGLMPEAYNKEQADKIARLQADIDTAKKEGYIQGARDVKNKATALATPPSIEGGGPTQQRELSAKEQHIANINQTITQQSGNWLDDAKNAGW